MAIIITSPVQGSLKVTNSSASPVDSFYCNLQTIAVEGAPFDQSVSLVNSNGQNIVNFKLSNISTIGASGTTNFTLNNAVDAIASLIMK